VPRREPRAPLIEVRDVSVRFGGIVALDACPFTIARRACSA
jgi:ABC-type branched-subunit amino acid transport system ATPase component